MSLKITCLIALSLCILSIPIHEVELSDDEPSNLYPVVGVLNLPISASTGYDPAHFSFFAASYASFLQMAGARVTVIPWDAPNITDYLAAVNGVLLTGGSLNLTYPNGTLQRFGQVLQTVIDFVYEINKERYYPLWGTCQGFQGLSIIISGNGTILHPCTGWCNDVGSTNTIVHEGRMFKTMSAELREKLATKNLTTYNHNWQVDYQSYFENPLLQGNMSVLATSVDSAGKEFIAAFEHRTLPIYGVQFHPEKATFEWKNKGYTHCYDCNRVTEHLANFFVQEVRKSNYTFNDTQYGWLLTYNYPAYNFPTSVFSSIYVFNNSMFSETQTPADLTFDYDQFEY